MAISKEIKESIYALVDKHVPKGKEASLYIDRRRSMKRILIKMYEKNPEAITITAVLYLVKNWKEFLYQRAAYTN